MIHKTIRLFEDKQEVTLTTYILDDSKEMLNGKKRPAVIINPGGAYLSLSDREAEPVAMQFAMMGYHAFVLRYSVYLPKEVSMMDFLMGKAASAVCYNQNSLFPNPMIELGKAILTVKEHSEEWFVDTDKIILCGFSAGAHNVAMYSTYWDKQIISNVGCEWDVHPKEKKKVGDRLALLALGHVYEREIVCDPPKIVNMEIEDGRVILSFESVGEGLILKGQTINAITCYCEKKKIELQNVQVCGAEIIIESELIQKNCIVYIEYGMSPYYEINLFNSADIPVMPFYISNEGID